MRTKTLLMTAAALAAGVIYSQAQSTVYSQNVVGYIDPAIPPLSYYEFANQLNPDSSDVPPNPASNNVNMALSTGMVSGSGPGTGSSFTNTTILIFGGVSYTPYYYYNATDAGNNTAGTTAGWYDANGNPVNFTLPQGGSVFLYNAWSGGSIETMSVGQVQQANYQGTLATNLIAVPNGYSLLSLADPISTNIDAAGIGLPDSKLTSGSGPGTGNFVNDTYLFYNGTAYIPFYYYNATDAGNNTAGTTAGFYDANGNPCTTYPAVGQGFVFLHSGGSFTYTNTFVVH